MVDERTPTVSVVAHAASPWPAVRPLLDDVLPQVEAVDGELVLGISDAGVLPLAQRGPRLRAVEVGRASPFALRAAAVAESCGPLIVVTEDHCRPEPGWLQAYLDAAGDRPRVAPHELGILVGTIGNGSVDTAADWASYLLNFAVFAPPVESVGNGRPPTIANLALARAVIGEVGRRPEGWLERDLVPGLAASHGVQVVPGAAVTHHQHFRGLRHARNHFHDARCAGALARTMELPPRSSRPGVLAAEARAMLRDTSAAVSGRPGLHRQHTRAAWWLRALAVARLAGIRVGQRWGPGTSPERIV